MIIILSSPIVLNKYSKYYLLLMFSAVGKNQFFIGYTVKVCFQQNFTVLVPTVFVSRLPDYTILCITCDSPFFLLSAKAISKKQNN